MTAVFIFKKKGGGGNLDTETGTLGGCEDEGRGQTETSSSQRTPKTASTSAKLGERILPHSLRRKQTC